MLGFVATTCGAPARDVIICVFRDKLQAVLGIGATSIGGTFYPHPESVLPNDAREVIDALKGPILRYGTDLAKVKVQQPDLLHKLVICFAEAVCRFGAVACCYCPRSEVGTCQGSRGGRNVKPTRSNAILRLTPRHKVGLYVGSASITRTACLADETRGRRLPTRLFQDITDQLALQ
jgi:hypothetical protein